MQGLVPTLYGSCLWCGKLEGQGGDQSVFTLEDVSEADRIPYSTASVRNEIPLLQSASSVIILMLP